MVGRGAGDMLGYKRGFTIVELLIVIVVIGILAGLVVVAFNGARSRATVSSVRTDASKLAKALELQKTEGSLPASLDPDASGLNNMKLSGPNRVAKYTASGSGYRACLIAVENGATTAYAIYDSSGGLLESGPGPGPAADCTPAAPTPPEYVNGIRCPVMSFGTPFVWNATTYRVRVTYSDSTISRITRINGVSTYIDQGAVDRHDFARSEGISWNNALMDVRGTNGMYRYDCTVTWSWPPDPAP